MSSFKTLSLSDEETVSATRSEEVAFARLERVLRMVRLLQSGRNYTSADLASHFGVGPRTIFRDIRMLRDCGITVDSAPRGGGYRIDSEVFQRPAQMKAHDFAVMVLGIHLARRSQATGLDEILRCTIERLLGPGSDSTQDRLDEFDRMFEIVDVSAIGAAPDLKWLGTLLQCISIGATIRVWVAGEDDGKNLACQELIPTRIRIASGHWWLVAEESDERLPSSAVRVLLELRRIEMLEFARPPLAKRPHF